MTKEELEKEAEEKAKKLEESQTIGIYDNNEDYEYDNGWNKGEIVGFEEGYLASAEPREKRIAELEKENAELKETLETYNGCGDWDNDFHTCRVYLQHEELQDYIEQLTKAKELLKWALHSDHEHDEDFEKKWEEAEQFLNSEVDK